MRTLLIWLPLKIGGLAALAGGILWMVGWVIYSIWIVSTKHGWLIAAEIILGVAVAIVGIFGSFFVLEAAKEKVMEFRSNMEHYEPKGIVGQWVKSLHEKICPCFEITD